MIAIFPLLLVITGILAYALSHNAKVQEIGRIMFMCGMMALAFALAGRIKLF